MSEREHIAQSCLDNFLARNYRAAPSTYPDLYGLPLDCEGFIASGTDSVVFRFQDKAIKIFAVPDHRKDKKWGRISFRKLQRYQQATWQAHQILMAQPHYAQLNQGIARVGVVPIDQVFYSNQLHNFVSISEFISGPALGDQAKIPHQDVWGIYRLSKQLSSLINFEGILVTPSNTKLVKHTNQTTLLITDLCADIRPLREATGL